MELPPPLSFGFHRFGRALYVLRIVLCVATLGTAVSAVMNDAVMEWTLVPLSAIHMKAVGDPPSRHASPLVVAIKLNLMVRALGFMLATLLFGLAGCVASIYVVCRQQPTRDVLWLCGYTVGGTGLLMLLGFGLRCLVGDHAVFGGNHAPDGLPSAYVVLWPTLFVVFGGCYVGLGQQAKLAVSRHVQDERASWPSSM